MVRSASRASVSARRARRRLLGQLLEQRRVGLLLGRRLGLGEPVLELGETGQVAVLRLLGLGDRRCQAVGLAACRTGGGTEVAEVLRDRRHRGVGLVQPAERRVDPLLGDRSLGVGGLVLEAQPLQRVLRAGQVLVGLRRSRP